MMPPADPQKWLRDNALTILDAVVDAIITIDVNGCIQSVNRATTLLFGYSEEELLGAPVSILMPEPHRTRHQSYIERYLSSREARVIGFGRELEAQTKTGQIFPVYLAISESESSPQTYFTGIVRDLSETKATQVALLEQREDAARYGRLSVMGEMTASIAHEINQPLTAIAMYAQASLRLLKSGRFDQATLISALEKLNTQSLRAGAVIERIQRFVRHETGEHKTTNISELVRDMEHLAEADARLHGVEFAFELDPHLPSVRCDAIQIQQVALNLLRNAIDSMDEIRCRNGNVVRILTYRAGNSIEVAVVDSGTGVPEDQRARVFSAFHTTKQDGMGMGLSICRSILDAHSGQIDFRNNIDHGCTFYFNLLIEANDE
jgi:two-component system sensor kinase FixL